MSGAHKKHKSKPKKANGHGAGATSATKRTPDAPKAETITHSREAVSRAIEDAAAIANKKIKAASLDEAAAPAHSPAHAREDARVAAPRVESEIADDDAISVDDDAISLDDEVTPDSDPYADLDTETEPPTMQASYAPSDVPPSSDDEPMPSSDDGGSPESRQTEAREVASQIRELEARLDRMIDEASRAHVPAHLTANERGSRPPPPPNSTRTLPAEGDATVFDTARELLSTDYYLRKWGRLGMRNRSEEVDDFGFDPIYEQKVLPFFNFLYEKYFRVETDGIERIPADGRCLLVANHSGTLPYDGVMIKTAVKREHPAHRDVRWLAEDFIFHFPFLGSFSNRIGAVRACQENAERLLRKDSLVAVFPEGVKGIGKLFKERYRLQRFGRGGFIKLCLRTGTPIVPVAVLGAEEANPMLARVEYLSKAIGLPYFPVTPTFPLLGPLGLVPAPTKWRISFGEPITFDGYGPEAADDEILVGRLAERVRATIQGMLDRGVGERRSIWFG
jgi:1-acyl-sn-glycerol-3-phosphate acyltransferase